MFDMFGIMDKLNKLKSATEETKRRLDILSVEATSANGWVKVECTGNKVIKDIQLSPELLKQDADQISDYLVNTINEVLRNADLMSKMEMKKATEGLMPNIPGVDLSQLGL